ncbi:MAG: peptide deformylase [Pseudomonadota bacterium]
MTLTVRAILKHPDAALQRVAERVVKFDTKVSSIVRDLQDTLEDAGGIGLSATQIDQHLQIIAILPTHNPRAPRIYVNPEITAKSAWGLVEESCLSVPGVVGHVFRATKVSLAAQDEGGSSFEYALEGMDAVCLQHEIDHLSGKLFTDRLPLLEKCRLQLKSLFMHKALQDH